ALEGFWTRTNPKLWDNFEIDDWVQVDIKTGEHVYGQIAGLTNDPNEERLEFYLESVASLDPATETWHVLAGTTGIYVPGDQIVLVQLMDPVYELDQGQALPK